MPDVLGSLDNLGIILAEHDIDRVLIAPGPSDPELILHTIRMIKSMGVKVSVLPRRFEVVGSSVEFDDLDGIPLLGLRRQGLPLSSRVLKRFTDLAFSAIALTILGPFLLLVALLVKIDSPGPVLFRQRRIGRHGQAFKIVKFRTMVVGADAMKPKLMELNEGAEGFFKMADDPRVTRVGKLLRKTYLDELPQLLNVFRGEMSGRGPAHQWLAARAPRPRARYHRVLAGARIVPDSSPRDGEDRLPLRDQLVAVAGRQGHLADRPICARPSRVVSAPE